VSDVYCVVIAAAAAAAAAVTRTTGVATVTCKEGGPAGSSKSIDIQLTAELQGCGSYSGLSRVVCQPAAASVTEGNAFVHIVLT
jgi:hypothetical protein